MTGSSVSVAQIRHESASMCEGRVVIAGLIERLGVQRVISLRNEIHTALARKCVRARARGAFIGTPREPFSRHVTITICAARVCTSECCTVVFMSSCKRLIVVNTVGEA